MCWILRAWLTQPQLPVLQQVRWWRLPVCSVLFFGVPANHACQAVIAQV
jgi:hypothetical protein